MENSELRPKLEQLKNGNMDVFPEIYEELKKPVYTVALRICGNKQDAEDVTQELFVRLAVKMPENPIKNPRAYIFQMAGNLAVDCVRKRESGVDMANENAAAFSENSILEKLDIEAAMDALPFELRQTVTLHLNAGLKFREIADIKKQPLGTVLWRYQKALGLLKKALSGGV